MKEVDGSGKGYINCYFQSQNELILGYYATGLIQVFDLNTFELTNEFKGHDGSVRCILKTDNFLITSAGSTDRKIKFWDLHTKQHSFTLTGHRGSVSSLHFFGNRLISGGGEGDIFLWDLNTHQRRSIVKHKGTVHELKIHNGKLISCSNDFTININDPLNVKNGQ